MHAFSLYLFVTLFEFSWTYLHISWLFSIEIKELHHSMLGLLIRTGHAHHILKKHLYQYIIYKLIFWIYYLKPGIDNSNVTLVQVLFSTETLDIIYIYIYIYINESLSANSAYISKRLFLFILILLYLYYYISVNIFIFIFITFLCCFVCLIFFLMFEGVTYVEITHSNAWLSYYLY